MRKEKEKEEEEEIRNVWPFLCPLRLIHANKRKHPKQAIGAISTNNHWLTAYIVKLVNGQRQRRDINEVGYPVLANSLVVGKATPLEKDVGHIFNLTWLGSSSMSVHRKNPM